MISTATCNTKPQIFLDARNQNLHLTDLNSDHTYAAISLSRTLNNINDNAAKMFNRKIHMKYDRGICDE
jgi:hypothetical protein